MLFLMNVVVTLYKFYHAVVFEKGCNEKTLKTNFTFGLARHVTTPMQIQGTAPLFSDFSVDSELDLNLDPASCLETGISLRIKLLRVDFFENYVGHWHGQLSLKTNRIFGCISGIDCDILMQK